MTTIVWFRLDLRLSDNPAFVHAAALGPVIPIYILDETSWPGGRRVGAASRWWLHHSLASLEQRLGGLVLLRGDPRHLLPALIRKTSASAVMWNRCYEPHAIARDLQLKTILASAGILVRSFNAGLLHEPWEVETGSGGPFRVYSPFWRACLQRPVPRASAVLNFALSKTKSIGEDLSSWQLLPRQPNWAADWAIIGARESLARPIGSTNSSSKACRDMPSFATGRTSRMSRGSSRICIGAKFRHGRSGPASRTQPDEMKACAAMPTNFCPSLAGASSPITCSITTRRCPLAIGNQPSTPTPGDSATEIWPRGRKGRPDIRLSMPACVSSGRQVPCTTACAWWRRASSSSICASIGAKVRLGSGTRCSTPILPTMPRAGSGLPAAVPMQRPIFASSIRWSRAAGSTRKAITSAAGVQNLPACRRRISTRRSRRRPSSCWRPAWCWARPTQSRSSITKLQGSQPLPATKPLRMQKPATT